MYKVKLNKHLLSVNDFIYSRLFDRLLFSWEIHRRQCPWRHSGYCTVVPQYSWASELSKSCTHIWMREKMFQQSALARDSLHLLELVWVTTPPHKRKCFITHHVKDLARCWLVSALVTSAGTINDEYRGTTCTCNCQRPLWFPFCYLQMRRLT